MLILHSDVQLSLTFNWLNSKSSSISSSSDPNSEGAGVVRLDKLGLEGSLSGLGYLKSLFCINDNVSST